MSIPRANLLFDFTQPTLERPDSCQCTDCWQIFYVMNGDTSTYFANCPFCRSSCVDCR